MLERGHCAPLHMQDDCKASPADKTPQHKSGVVGDQPNQQMILSVTPALCCFYACLLLSSVHCRDCMLVATQSHLL